MLLYTHGTLFQTHRILEDNQLLEYTLALEIRSVNIGTLPQRPDIQTRNVNAKQEPDAGEEGRN